MFRIILKVLIQIELLFSVVDNLTIEYINKKTNLLFNNAKVFGMFCEGFGLIFFGKLMLQAEC